MAQTSFFKRRWKLLLNIATIILLVALVIGIREQLVETFRNFARIHAWFLLLMIPLEVVNYHAQTKLYQQLFGVVGNKLSYGFLMKASLELNFVNHVFPSAGVSGISYFGARLKSNDISGSKATLVQVMKLVLTFLSLELLIIFGVFALAVGGHVNNIVMLVAGAFVALAAFGTPAAFYIVNKRSRITAFFSFVTRVINRLIKLVRPNRPETINMDKAHHAFDDLHDNYMKFRHNIGQLKMPFVWALIANITELAVIYVVFLAFGHAINVGALILAYAIANFAGLISVLPGGTGIYEGLMTAVLVTTGVPAAVSLPVIIMYRILNTILQVPPGYVLYQRNLNKPKFSGDD